MTVVQGGVDLFPWSVPKDFESALKSNGVPITFNSTTKLGVDIAVVDASIKMAILNTRTEAIRQKLERLLQNGTKAQRLEFVLGEGIYHFPEDLDMVAERDAPNLCHRFCEVTYFVVCSFTDNGEQVCRELARNICTFECN